MVLTRARRRGLAALAVGAALLGGAGRAVAGEPRRHPWYVPDHFTLQLAGNIGFLSPGVGYEWAGGRLHGEAFVGWVPRAIGGDDIWSVTGKLAWLPWRIALGPRWYVTPITGALQLTYTFGEEYFVLLPRRYPKRYYDFPTALRAGIGIGGAIARRTGGGAVREVAAYWELVALDAMIVSWIRNPRALGPGDVFSLSLGIRVGL